MSAYRTHPIFNPKGIVARKTQISSCSTHGQVSDSEDAASVSVEEVSVAAMAARSSVGISRVGLGGGV